MESHSSNLINEFFFFVANPIKGFSNIKVYQIYGLFAVQAQGATIVELNIFVVTELPLANPCRDMLNTEFASMCLAI